MRAKRYLAFALALVLLLPCLPTALGASHPFSDVSSGQWYAESVDYCYTNHLMNGTGDTTFAPEANMSRAMLVTVLYRIDGRPSVNGSPNPFKDVAAETYYSEAVVWAYHNQITTGTSETTFDPVALISREQMVTFFYRYASCHGYDISANADLSGYTDAGQIHSYAQAAFQWAVAEGIINGTTNTTLSPNGNATRAQCAVIIHRFVEWAKSKSPGIGDFPFTIRYLDVGEADAALVQCDGHYMLIDGGNASDSNLIYTVLKENSITHLDIVVGSHAHEDHIGGLPGAFQWATTDRILCPVTSFDSEVFENFARYASLMGGITVPSAGDSYPLGSATVTILGVNAGTDDNDRSIILKVEYGDTSFLFTGDAEQKAEQAAVDSGADLSASVLKVGHHGSDTSTTDPFLRQVMPEYAIISVGKDNAYDHPSAETLSRLLGTGVKIYRTDLHGDITVVSDGNAVTVFTEKTTSYEAVMTPGDGSSPVCDKKADYVVNTSSGKFHDPSCPSADNISESNRLDYVGTRQKLIEQGYTPCGNCKP